MLALYCFHRLDRLRRSLLQTPANAVLCNLVLTCIDEGLAGDSTDRVPGLPCALCNGDSPIVTEIFNPFWGSFEEGKTPCTCYILRFGFILHYFVL